MVLKYLPLIIRALNKLSYIPYWTSREDLYQEGFIALNKAIKTFDQTRSSDIEAYIIYYIYLRLLDFLKKKPKKTEKLDKSMFYNDKYLYLIEVKDSIDKYSKRCMSFTSKYSITVSERKSLGVCVWCGNSLEGGNKNYCKKHKEIINAKRRQRQCA